MEYAYYGFCLTESEEHFLHTIGLGDVPRRHSFTTRNQYLMHLNFAHET